MRRCSLIPQSTTVQTNNCSAPQHTKVKVRGRNIVQEGSLPPMKTKGQNLRRVASLISLQDARLTTEITPSWLLPRHTQHLLPEGGAG